jgi:hypothetical protein
MQNLQTGSHMGHGKSAVSHFAQLLRLSFSVNAVADTAQRSKTPGRSPKELVNITH